MKERNHSPSKPTSWHFKKLTEKMINFAALHQEQFKQRTSEEKLLIYTNLQMMRDNGKQFTSEIFKRFLEHNNIKDKPIPKSYPQLQGKVEAYNKIVNSRCHKNQMLLSLDIWYNMKKCAVE